MQAQTSAHAAHSAVQSAPATERTHLMGWPYYNATQRNPPPTEAPHSTGFLDHISLFTHPLAGQTPAVQNQAHHFWQINRSASHPVHPYTPGVADALRHDAMAVGARLSVSFFAIAGFMDAEFPHGTSIFNPSGTRNNLAGLTCLLGGYLAVTSLTPFVTYHAYCALLYTCNKLGDKLHAHPLSTRAVGLASSAVFATGALAGAWVLHEQNVRRNRATTPENGWVGSTYSEASVLSLIVSAPALAALGWYVGRMGSAAVRRDPNTN